MPSAPARPKIYHITHVENLPSIVADGCLVSDATMIARGGPSMTIGMSGIKRRRLSLPVHCHSGDCVGDYVPFYFSSRSVMLYLIYRGNHPELSYAGGQGSIVHLEADLRDVVAWADGQGRRWAFTLSNAGAVYAQFRASLDDLDEVNWSAVAAKSWSEVEIKEGKQAEFLVRDSLPWHLVSRIGVSSMSIKSQVDAALPPDTYVPKVEIKSSWYY